MRVTLNASAEQAKRLVALQAAFAQVCNALAPLVQQNRMWNRVTLHHLAYRSLREQFPQMGSQMVCNAIYSVSRTARLVFQHPASPFHLSRYQGKPLPTLHFSDRCPVYFDRHTLSVKDGALSMYTLDGRMRFLLSVSEEDERSFREKKLREIVLSRKKDGAFELVFWFGDALEEEAARAPLAPPGQIPDYVKVEAAA
ncbi:hypothetical protein [Ramlibacter sp.]|uniref:hypothetical protein n=1 Tax=Ramlibacter sp. TaxID=1917967 RepID=UPI002BE4E270|nr:hypothetical protein [Ramlibacter sp.]HWI84501.1 hypothetical protein [Ramlibacter sp.]